MLLHASTSNLPQRLRRVQVLRLPFLLSSAVIAFRVPDILDTRCIRPAARRHRDG